MTDKSGKVIQRAHAAVFNNLEYFEQMMRAERVWAFSHTLKLKDGTEVVKQVIHKIQVDGEIISLMSESEKREYALEYKADGVNVEENNIVVIDAHISATNGQEVSLVKKLIEEEVITLHVDKSSSGEWVSYPEDEHVNLRVNGSHFYSQSSSDLWKTFEKLNHSNLTEENQKMLDYLFEAIPLDPNGFPIVQEERLSDLNQLGSFHILDDRPESVPRLLLLLEYINKAFLHESMEVPGGIFSSDLIQKNTPDRQLVSFSRLARVNGIAENLDHGSWKELRDARRAQMEKPLCGDVLK